MQYYGFNRNCLIVFKLLKPLLSGLFSCDKITFEVMFSDLIKEVRYRTSKSGGSGGQHVNKVSTKVILLFNVAESEVLSKEQKEIIFTKLKNRISNDGLLILHCDETRSQLKNKTIVNERFTALITKALVVVKKRKKTKPTKSSVERRIKDKKKISEKKEFRKPPGK